ncbi:MAG: Cof-type HAD-IIB family hydrolase [Firmicutes bacterium]|nr:Cof-type HAD-IIB family hydrolase [Bacillota bacterium]
MGNFEGILICSDLDETLLTTDKRVSDENKQYIEYFMSEGGKFTFTTGRVPRGARLILDYIVPNAPIVAFNGAGLYDFARDEMTWGTYLDEHITAFLEDAEHRFKNIAINICTDENVYFCKINEWSERYRVAEKLPPLQIDYHDIPKPWKKALFITEGDHMEEIKQGVRELNFADKFDFVRSSENYFEVLPKGASKGNGMIRLADMLGIEISRTIALGDNENDISMLEAAGVGVAVSNAVDSAKNVADIITVSNNESAVAKIIKDIESGKISV